MIFKHRIDIKSDTSADGEVDPSYTTLLEDLPCTVVPVNGGEVYRGKQLQAETTIVIETRFYSGILPNMIAVNDLSGSEYLIRKVLKANGRERFLMIEAREVVV